MGSNKSKPLDRPDISETSEVDGHLVTAAVMKARGGEGCPVSGGKGGERDESGGGCPVRGGDRGKGGGGCPLKGKRKYKNEKQYDVYGREINEDNNMPKTAAQDKAPGQKMDLPTERVKSNIPKVQRVLLLSIALQCFLGNIAKYSHCFRVV